MSLLNRRLPLLFGPLVVLLWAAVLPGDMSGQAIRGSIRDTTTNVAIQNARVTIIDRTGDTVTTVLSGRDGVFLAVAPDWGRYIISIVQLGYEPVVTAPLKLLPNDTAEMSYHMRPLALLMDPVIVEANAALQLVHVQFLQQEGYFARQRRTHGRFLAPEEIERQRGFTNSADDYLQGQPNVTRGERLRLGCGRPRLWIDGNRLLFAGSLAEGVDPFDVLAIEIYDGTMTPSPPYGTCDIVVWTRRKAGGESPRF